MKEPAMKGTGNSISGQTVANANTLKTQGVGGAKWKPVGLEYIEGRAKMLT